MRDCRLNRHNKARLLGLRLSELMDARQRSVKDVAEFLDVSEHRVKRYIAGIDDFSAVELGLLAEDFGLPVNQFYEKWEMEHWRIGMKDWECFDGGH